MEHCLSFATWNGCLSVARPAFLSQWFWFVQKQFINDQSTNDVADHILVVILWGHPLGKNFPPKSQSSCHWLVISNICGMNIWPKSSARWQTIVQKMKCVVSLWVQQLIYSCEWSWRLIKFYYWLTDLFYLFIYLLTYLRDSYDRCCAACSWQQAVYSLHGSTQPLSLNHKQMSFSLKQNTSFDFSVIENRKANELCTQACRI